VHVLLVEDNPVNRVAARMLQRLGCSVDVAPNGLAALDAFDASRHALVLMDLSMPVLDGLEATRRLRERERGSGRRVPIVALTANAMEGDRERCLDTGMDDYLTKPIRAEALAELIARCASRVAAKPPAP
jgi:CheY-like chemotaxis protein